MEDKKKNPVKSKTVGDICRETFRFPVQRTGEGWAVVWDTERVEIGKLRFGLDREEKELEATVDGGSPTIGEIEAAHHVKLRLDVVPEKSVQAELSDSAVWLDEEGQPEGDWEL